jgi:glycosyltransferase involved in cell wall biosynthesis
MVGRLAAQKNQVLALRAFAVGAPRDHRLALAGAETDAGYRALVAAEARALGVADRVHFLGNLDPKEGVPDLLALARVVLVPSRHEAFGLAVLEAWAAGSAVLFARRSGLADLARSLRDPSVALETLDVEEWSRRLSVALADDAYLAAAAKDGGDLVRDRFTWSRVAARLASLYAEVVDENRAGTRAA